MRRRKRHKRAHEAACGVKTVVRALCWHHCRLFGTNPYPWLCSSPNSTDATTEPLGAEFAQLHALVAKLGSETDAITRRMQSVAAWWPQAQYYSQLVANDASIRTICEVGFNVGHSAAVWLTASPRVRLETFDLFSSAHSQAALAHITSRFPGRVSAHKGNSLLTVPAAAGRLSAPCDLVVIDGRHEFEAVVHDFISLAALAAPSALYLFDDICDHTRCEDWAEGNAIHMGGPTLALCELRRAGLLTLLNTSFGGVRSWVLATVNQSADLASIRREIGRTGRLRLPCASDAPRCMMRWSRRAAQTVWAGSEAPFGDRARRAQQRMSMGPACRLEAELPQLRRQPRQQQHHRLPM